MTESSSAPARRSALRNYAFSLVLLGSVAVGCVLGLVLKGDARILKPFGDVFLNGLVVTVVPLIFFTIASAVASMASTTRLLKVLGWMLVVFVATGIVSSGLMIAGVSLFPPAQGVSVAAEKPKDVHPLQTSDQIVRAFTAPDFVELLSKRNVLALIVFAILVGLGTSMAGEKGRPFATFLASGGEVMMKVVRIVMYYAPLGMAACFADLVGVFGPSLLGDYGRAMALYYPLCAGYFFVAFTFYALLAGGPAGIGRFWKNVVPPSLTALATGSSYATIPSNLLAADRVGVPREISEVVIPMGATIHMDGSCLAAVLKIAFLFGLYHRPFEGAETIATAVVIALLSGTVMSGIPGGGFTGELLIVSMYGFPPESLVIINMIGQLVDAPATLVNATGDNVASMMVARIVGGRQWMKAAAQAASA